MRFGSKLIHNGNEIDKHTGAVSIPIYQVSTYHHDDIDKENEYVYSRFGNPTRKALENTIAILEGGEKGFAFSSGMAAISSVLSIFSSGDHILVCEDVYGGTHTASTCLFNRFNLEMEFFNACDSDCIKKNIKNNTKAIYLETPSNPLLRITDLKNVIKVAKDSGLIVIIDNTFMTPYLQNPIEFGADIVIHSATKFIGGHSDVVGGLVAVKGEELAKRIEAIQVGFGSILGPQDSWLLLRGLKTLKVRMDCQQNTANKLAQWLSNHEKVEEVFYPGLETHPGNQIHLSQSKGGGAVLSFRTKDTETAKSFMKKVKLAVVAVSLGGVESIISYPCQMSHKDMPKEEREKVGITESLIRLSVGIEEFEDLVEDFEKAFS